MGRNVWVMPGSPHNWLLKKEGCVRESGEFKTQRAAIKAGREIAKKEKSELIVQNRLGLIRMKDSFGHDPRNVKG